MLLLDEFVDSAEVVLHFLSIPILRDLAAFCHLSHVVLEFACTGSWNFLVV